MMRKKPMLAYPASNKPIDYNQDIFMQPKLDGVRCVIQYENRPLKNVDDLSGQLTENVVVAYSRTGKEWKNIDHILFNLKPWFALNPNVILDGELYNHDLKDDFEKIISLVRKQKPDDIDMLESADMVQFHCYDIIDETMSFAMRNEFIKQAVPRNHCVHHVPTTKIVCDDDAQEMHKVNLNCGFEGSILRTNDVYACKRSHNLRKFKDFSDAEALIIGYVDGKGKREGTLGKFIMQDDEGVEFGCPPGKGYTYAQLKDILDNIGDYIGERATFTYFERTKAGSYRHPLFKCIRNYE
jgi:ATP-dependent DNA ligase